MSIILKQALKLGLSFLKDNIDSIEQAKAGIVLEENEDDVVIIFFLQDKVVIGSICTLTKENQISRIIENAPLVEFIESFLKHKK